MSDVYAAYGPLPSSLGVTPSPPPDEDLLERRRYSSSAHRHNLHPSDASLLSPSSHTDEDVPHPSRMATLARCGPGVGRTGHHGARTRYKEDVVRSHQDLRRSISRAAMERAPEPLQLLARLDSLDSTAARLRGSLQKLDSPICFDRRRNGSAVSTTGFSTTYSSTPCSVHAYGSTASRSRRDSRAELDLEEEEQRCCLKSPFCKIVFSIFLCLIILGFVIAALYFFIRHKPYEVKNKYEEGIHDPCTLHRCHFGAICVPAKNVKEASCQCPTDCSHYGLSLLPSTVCGSDGRNYENECELRKRACYDQRGLILKYNGFCDPCEEVECTEKQVCHLDRDRQPMCRCNDVCNRDYDPVCASDGKTYSNECVMKVEGCKRRRPLSIIYRGECSDEVNPCDSISCLPGEECNIDVFGIARCECPPPCEKVVRPVCGSDGQTYDNKCELWRNVCVKQENISVQYTGVCGEEGPCSEYDCEFGAICVDRQGRPVCECPDCPAQLDPVCGSDGLSYDNECYLRAEGCRQRRSITVRYRGKCSGCEEKVCNFYGVCEANERGEGACVCPDACPEVESPVCGSDGVTYLNECLLKVASCKKQELIVVASRGDCDLCKHVICKYGGRCESGECICPTSCHTTREPVCASNAVTYLNECEMDKASCRMGRGALRVVFFGECAEARSSGITGGDPCTIMSCEFGSTCVVMTDGLPRCTCTLDCTDAVKDPVCASDLKMYPNECTMNREACQRQIELRLRPLELCEDYELVPCNRAPPLINPLTGRDFYCGQGPDKEECPHGSYCHWSLSFAKCCPMDEETNMTVSGPQCKTSPFGCCPDAKTEAQGPNYAGCPSICQCHKLGSFEATCDPVTNQCRCKPGVGGTKCDRCEPGYWGLPQIQHGSKGCQPCACSLFGSVRDDCEQMTGQCICKPGIGGKKCSMCPSSLILGPKGCMTANQLQASSPQSCADLECFFGAKCHVRNGHPECLCDAQCPSDSSSATPICGSDGETYGSECHLKLYACRYQKDVVVDSLGPCPPLGNQSDGVTESPIRRSTAPLSTEPHRDHSGGKSTRHLPSEYHLINGEMTSSLSNSILRPTAVTFAVFGLLGSLCYRDKDCSVAYSHCYGSLCTCKRGYAESTNRQTCVATTPGREAIAISPCSKTPCKYGGTCHPLPGGSFTCHCTSEATGPLCENFIKPPYEVPAFGGSSYLEIKKIKAYNKVQVELEFRSFTDSGFLVYSQQKEDGSGDFVSLAIVDGFVEFRYNLGSGPAVIRSHHKITPKKFHKVVAKRYQRDGMLQLDDAEGSIGQAPGHLKSLDLRGSTYIGYMANASRRVWENVGTSEGLVGCIRSVRINGRPLDLLWPGSPHVTRAEHISECAQSPCYKLPCQNQGLCRPTDDGGYKCTCVKGYSGDRCHIRESPCETNPCQDGGTCLALPSKGFACKCPPGRTGKLCDKMDKTLKEFVIPEFNGDSYLEFPTLESAEKSFALEIWFLPRTTEGVLLYNGQKGEGGDFVAVNLRDGHVEFSYNLGSGIASLITKETVELHTWQVVRVRRRKRRGLLQLNKGKKIRGKSGPRLAQLNLDMPLYLGGLRNYSEAHPDSGVSVGFSGAIQRLMVNMDVWENLPEKAVGGRDAKRFRGPPCNHNPCQNSGVCHPYLNRFICKCPSGYQGKFCQKGMDYKEHHKPVLFDGSTYLKFPNMVHTVNISSYNYTNSDYWENSLPLPWSPDGDLMYPSEYDDDYNDHDDFIFLEEDDYDLGGEGEFEEEEEIEEGEEYKEEEKGPNQLGPVVNNGEKNNAAARHSHKLTPPLKGNKASDFVKYFEDLDYLSPEKTEEDETKIGESQNGDLSYIEQILKGSANDDPSTVDSGEQTHAEESDSEESADQESSQRGQHTNQFEINFKASSGEGLMLWISKGGSLDKDYLAIALSRGNVELSYNLGKQKEPFRIVSKVSVDDGKWHKVVVHRRKRLGILRVDSETPIKGLSAKGAKDLNTNGKLWIGGVTKLPAGLPPSYYIGFRGCIKSVEVNNKDLNLVKNGDSNELRFCDSK